MRFHVVGKMVDGMKCAVLIAMLFMLPVPGDRFGAGNAMAQPPVPTSEVDSMSTERQTAEGTVIGTLHRATNTLSWKGIPYAKPPVGKLRWKAPEMPDKRSMPLHAVNFCELCPQYTDHDDNPATPQVIQGKEDCLYLNIWRPKTRDARLPVYVWIHGGGNSKQWPLLSDLDGSRLANKSNLVVVTVNYRLGPMGFFSHPALRSGKKGDELSDSGNFAILDLVRALSWIKDNIKAFGGDPENVTITGESAGATNVIRLLASPPAKNLFHRALAQSGGIRMFTPAQGAEHASTVIARLFVKDGRAPDVSAAKAKLQGMALQEVTAYLHSKTPQEFLEVYPEGKQGGMIAFLHGFGDGTVLPADFYGALKNGDYHKVPVILGTNKEETKLFQMSDPIFAPWMKDGSLLKDAAKGDLYDLVAKYQSDAWKVWGVDQVARILRANPDQPMVYAYQFLWGAGSAAGSVLPAPYDRQLGACHTMEIDFIFGTEAAALGGVSFTEKNRPGREALSQAMMEYFAQFARTGSPNREGSVLPGWKPWSNIDGFPKTILLDADDKGLKIEISRKELTQDDVENALQAEPRRQEIQPFWNKSPHKSSLR